MNLNLKHCWGGNNRRSGGTKDGNYNKGGSSSDQTPTPPSGGSSSGQTPTTSQDGSSTNPNNQSGSTSVGGSYAADGVSSPTQQQDSSQIAHGGSNDPVHNTRLPTQEQGSREVLTTDDLDAPVRVSSEEGAENSPSQPGTSNHSPHMAAGGSKDQVDNYQYSVQEQGTEDAHYPLKEIIRSLPNGSSQLVKDDIRKNEKRYRRFLLHVAQNAADSWQAIGGKGNLGLKDPKIQSLKNNHSSEGSEEQAYQMLVYWMNSDENPTLEKLLTVLIDTGKVEVAKHVSDVLTTEYYKSRGGKPVTEALLNRITKDIKDVWKFLGRYLGIDENTIHSITMDNRDNTGKQAQQMLIKWKESNANHATSQVLISALEDVGKTNVASFVQEWEKAKSPEEEKIVLGFM